MKRRRRSAQILVGVIVGASAASFLWIRSHLAAMPNSPPIYVRFASSKTVSAALHDLQARGIIKDAGATRLYALLHGASNHVPAGTYKVHAGETADEILASLRNPIRQMVRLPETNWAKRDANLLAKAQVIATAHDYMALVSDPKEFRNEVSFPLPKLSLEGYLFPDTYELPPLLGARSVVERQLKAFDQKVYRRIGSPQNIQRIVTKASLVELEAGTDEDRNEIAGIIENRLSKGIPLQIDASLLYGMGKWKRLHFKDYTSFKSPYNLYLHKGLPPTPICSPSLKSIVAVMHPSHHDYLFYVAMPNGSSLFAKTFAQHKHNIKLRLAALHERELSRQAEAFSKPAEASNEASP